MTWLLLAALAFAAPSFAQSACAGVLARVAAQVCSDAEFAELWQTMDRLETARSVVTRHRFERTLRVCRGVAGSDPQPCLERRVWARVSELGRAADTNSAIGRYLGGAGRAVAIWPSDVNGYTRIRINLPHMHNRHCTIELSTWRLRGEQTFVGERIPGDRASYCDFKLRRIGRDVVIAGDALCRAACAAEVDYAGRYQLQR